MNVLIVTNQVIDIQSGTCRVVTNFYDIIKRFEYLGNIRLFAQLYNEALHSHVKIEKTLEEITPNDVCLLKKMRLYANTNARKIIEREIEKTDLVIVYIPYDISIYAYYYAKKHHKKFMPLLVGCPWDAYWNHGLLGKILAPYEYLITRKMLAGADYAQYVTNSFLQNRYPSKCRKIGVSNVMIYPMSDNILSNRLVRIEQSDLSQEIKIITTGAIDVRYKGQEYVIKALAKLSEKGDRRFHYYIVGGKDKTFLSNLAKKLGVENYVHFLGVIPHKDIFTTLDDMHIYIQPSLQEGLPRSMVEAMSRGLLCIGARTAAIPELIENAYVTERKSVDDIVRILSSISKDKLQEQAARNFNEAKKYQETELEKRRNAFYDIILKETNNNNA